jgi:hypothetical protein
MEGEAAVEKAPVVKIVTPTDQVSFFFFFFFFFFFLLVFLLSLHSVFFTWKKASIWSLYRQGRSIGECGALSGLGFDHC